ncbi:FtsX-like permease family protein [Streptomyces sp. NPDC001732]
MLRLALSALRARPASFAGLAMTLLLAVAVVTLFGSLIATAISTDGASRLGMIGGAFGEIAMLMSLFVVANTLGFSVRQQYRDVAMLRTSGATPVQIKRLVRFQVLLVTLLVSPLAWLLGAWGARWFLTEIVARDMAPATTTVPWSPWPMLIGTAATLLVGVGAAKLAVRRVIFGRPSTAMALAVTEHGKLGWVRGIAGVIALVGAGGVCVFISGQPADKAAQGALLGALVFMLAVGLLGPVLARAVVAVVGVPLRLACRTHRGEAGGWLAATNLLGHAHRMASAVVPIALLIGLSLTFTAITGTIQHSVTQGVPEGAYSESDIWLRGVELAMLAGFGAVATVNTLVSLTSTRRREYALLTLTGATRRQLFRMLGAEAVVTATTGALLGVLVAAPVSVAFAWAATDKPWPWIPVETYSPLVLGAMALAAVTIMLSGAWATTRPAVSAVAAP